MGQTLGVGSTIQAPRLLTTSSQGALFLPQMSIQRDAMVSDIIYTVTCNPYDTEASDKWNEHQPLPVVDTPKMTIPWDFPVRTDRTIQADRPDILMKLKQNKTCQLTDMSVPSDSNISAKEFEKLSRYKDLEIEIAKMWKMKTKTLPVIVGALGIIKKRTQKYVNEIPGNLFLAEIKKCTYWLLLVIIPMC